ncbi:hypothetical protein 2011_scaffold13_00062 [Bacteriophage sp.]|nr:hypothetical protein 2011_scaffold13_00062 [Bacteriophage sp.]
MCLWKLNNSCCHAFSLLTPIFFPLALLLSTEDPLH